MRTTTISIYHERMAASGRHIQSFCSIRLVVATGVLLCLAPVAGAADYPAAGPQPVPPLQFAPLPPAMAPPINRDPMPYDTGVPQYPADGQISPCTNPGSAGILPASERAGRPRSQDRMTLPERIGAIPGAVQQALPAWQLVPAPQTTAAPATEPPALPDRPPLPVPPDLTLPSRGAPVVPKPPLAWRAKAYALSEQPAAKGPFGTLSRTFDRTAEDVYSAIVPACAGAGIVIESLNSAAGEILGSFAEDPTGEAKVIISVKETAPLRTTVTGTIVGSGRALRQAALASLFSSVDMILAGNGAL